MRRFAFGSLRARMILIVTGVVAICALLVLQQTLRATSDEIRDDSDELNSTTAFLVAQASRTALVTDRYDDLQPRLESLAETQRIDRIDVADRSGRIVASSVPSNVGASIGGARPTTGDTVETVELTDETGLVGTARVEFSATPIDDAVVTARNRGLWMTILGVGGAGLVAWAASRTLTRRLRRVTDGVAGFDIEAPFLPLEVRGSAEVTELTEAFNHTAAELRADRERVAEATAALRASEARFRTLADSAPLGVFLADRRSHVVYTNERFRQIWGRDEAELADEGWVLAVPASDRARVIAANEAAIAGGHLLEVEFPIERPDAEERWVAIRSAVVVGDGDPDTTFAVGTAEDITNRRVAELALADSERRYRLLVEHSPGVTFQVRVRAGAVAEHYVSPQIEAMLGLPVDEALADVGAIIERVPAGERDGISGRILEASARDGALSFEVPVSGAHGEERWLSVQAETTAADDGYTVQGVGVDVTERRRAEADLRLRDRAITDASVGVLFTDPRQPDNPIVYVNPAFQRITGYSADEAIGQNCRFLQGDDRDQPAIEELRSAIADQRFVRALLRNYRKDGSLFWNELTISPLFDEEGALTHFVGIQVDVTTQHELEAQLLQAQKMEALGRLAGGIAHDFNNMLGIVSMHLHLMEQEVPAGGRTAERITRMHDATRRATDLVSELMAFARESPRAEVDVDLDERIEALLPMIDDLLGARIGVAAELGAGPCIVRADPGWIDQVLMNLVVNARDAMPDGGTLELETGVDSFGSGDHPRLPPGDYVRLTVADDGTGMDEVTAARVFEPFFTTKPMGQGTGLGLATAYAIVTRSGGDIVLATQPGVGSRFTVHWPRRPAADVGDMDEDAAG